MYTYAKFIKDLGAKPHTDRQTDGHGEIIRVPFYYGTLKMRF